MYKHTNYDVKDKRGYTGKEFALDYLDAIMSRAKFFYSETEMSTDVMNNCKNQGPIVRHDCHLKNPNRFEKTRMLHKLVSMKYAKRVQCVWCQHLAKQSNTKVTGRYIRSRCTHCKVALCPQHFDDYHNKECGTQVEVN